MIRGENLKKTFQNKLIFENVNFEIPAGKITGIYGRSGIGKSTLAKILCGVQPPDEGRVYLDDKLLYSADTSYDRKRGIQIQMVYQQPYSALDGNQKIIAGFRELIRYHRFARTREETDALIGSLMEQVGLETDILNHRPHQISGGEAQRISIAQCLLFKPRLLVLDEATSMLDVSTQANIIALLRRVMAPSNGAMMIISHDREMVEYLCDQIYVFDQYTLKKEIET